MVGVLAILAAELLSFSCFANAVLLSDSFRGTRSKVKSTAASHREIHPHLDGVEHRFASFMQEHGRAYKVGSDEYSRRLSIFATSLAQVNIQNARPDRAWIAGLNEFSDWTKEESDQLRGVKMGARSAQNSVSFIGSGAVVTSRRALPKSVSWAHLKAFSGPARNQGTCGSCWAFATVGVLNAHIELHSHTGEPGNWSVQQVVSCTQNPDHCGGTGGCGGATAELGMNYILAATRLESEANFRYSSNPADEQCPSSMRMTSAGDDPRVASLVQATSFGMTSYVTLEQNRLEPVLRNLYEKGPLAISVYANQHWNEYFSGVMNACEDSDDFIINHAVILLGYGEGVGLHGKHESYWLILNSWGPGWGEDGKIRLTRWAEDDEKHCFHDSQPLQGTGCETGPNKAPAEGVTVCGTCGILYDTVRPEMITAEASLISRLRS